MHNTCSMALDYSMIILFRALLVVFAFLTVAISANDSTVTTSTSSNKKYLIISIDSRDLDSNVENALNSYISVTAVINHEYCKHHGYDFFVYKMHTKDLESRVNSKYKPMEPPPRPTHGTKDYASAFNVHLLQFRGATWAKIPVLWEIAYEYQDKYDYIMMVDSDAAFNPMHFNRSLDDALKEWNSNQTQVVRGNPTAADSTFIFMNNYPWRDDMPCTGAIIFKPKQAEPMFREWWDYNLPAKNFIHFHEQDVLWHMIEANEDYGFQINNKTFSLLSERQFPSPWTAHKDLWLTHIASYNFALRKPIFSTFLHLLNLGHKDKFEAAVGDIELSHMKTADVLNATERMEVESLKLPEIRKTKFPPHDVASQQPWYDAHRTSDNDPVLPAAYLYDNCMIAGTRGASLWIVENQKKRLIPNWDTFMAMNLSSHWVFKLDAKDVSSIADGPPMPALDYQYPKL